MKTRSLTGGDRSALAGFTCARLGEPWAEALQAAIREDLADDIARGRISTVGLFDDDRWCGLAVWRTFPTTPILSQGYTVAVAVGERRRGHGRRLKLAMLDGARAAGAVAVSSIVDRRNGAMVALNKAFGARVAYPDDDPDNCYCFIELT